jgi:tRNA(fMet)-specific endonuclease VapC
LADDDDPAIAAITAAELLQGVERADGVHRVARQSEGAAPTGGGGCIR